MAMNTTQLGNQLEVQVFDRVKRQLASGRHQANPKLAKVFMKKGYFSEQRKAEIITDVSLETYSGENEISVLWIYECKNYRHSVPVDDAEEFVSKLTQIGNANTKGVIISTAGFQRATIEFAKANKLGLYRFIAKRPTEIILHLETTDLSASNNGKQVSTQEIRNALTYPEFESEIHEGAWFEGGKIGFSDFETFVKRAFDDE